MVKYIISQKKAFPKNKMRLGVDIGGTNLKLGLISDLGRVEKHKIYGVDDLLSASNLFDELLSCLNDFIGQDEITFGGISAKGLIDSKEGKVIDDVGLGKELKDRSICDVLSEIYRVPFSIENDAKCYAWGEYKFGFGQRYENFCCITLGTGIGCAYVDAGTLFSGYHPSGGVLGGHISIDRHGPVCDCGNIGCFEMFCSKNGILRILEASIPSMLLTNDPVLSFFKSVKNGDLKSIEVFNDFIQNLSVGIVNIINAYSPKAILLGGGIMNSADIILPEIKKIVYKRAFTSRIGECVIERSTLGNHAPLLGAAFLPKMENL